MTETSHGKETLEFGKQIFSEIDKSQPSAFNQNYWSGRIMEWSMTQPEFKTNMFRLIDVLPALKNSTAIAQHVNEYLGKVGAHIHSLAEWGLNVKPHSVRAIFTALLVKKGVKQMASQFIAGALPQDAHRALRRIRRSNMSFTVDLLGEYCLCEKEAEQYLKRYLDALENFGENVPRWKSAKPIIPGHPGELSPVCISVKLTALYSQCGPLNFDRSVRVLTERLTRIVRQAKKYNALIYIDAEDTANNPIIYETFRNVFGSEEFKDFPYPGIVIQAYARDSETILYEMIDFAKSRGAPIAVRLVKGAYWDHETIMSAQNNWPSPLFSVKESSDANFEKLSRIMIDNVQHCLPAFGSHNIRSLSHACCYAKQKGLEKKDLEIQVLYGMAEPIARAFMGQGYLVRFYVALGEMIPGMGYLVRRLLENTSNESFLRHTFFDESNVEQLLMEPRLQD
ncbi:proline dehydrogenase family protein [Oligoflexia bacterium]|nr:proline dehydrogenase family protein [Oligoflexia bacterium]